MLSEYITGLADVSFRIVAYMAYTVSVFGKKSDAVFGFLAYFCAILRFSDPPYAPLLTRCIEKYTKITGDVYKHLHASGRKNYKRLQGS